MTYELVRDCTNHINGRKKGAEARIARLTEAGCPLDRSELRRWLESRLNADHEQAGGLFQHSTMRLTHGGDPNLPSTRRYGSYITRVALELEFVAAGTEQPDEEGEPFTVEESYWFVHRSHGSPIYIHQADLTADEAEAEAKLRLLADSTYHTTYAAALAAVTREVEARETKLAAKRQAHN